MGISRPSEPPARARRQRVWRWAVAALLAVAGATPLLARAPREPSLAGEGGLWVERAEREVTVRWLTARPGPGYLQVAEPGQAPREFRTPAATAHAVAFRPRAGRVTLRYGSADDPSDRHETALRLRPGRGAVSVGRVDSIFVTADVHGDFERLLMLLRNAALVDDEGHWSGGRSHLVFLGDLMDRGQDVTRLLWFVYGLEEQAARAGGRVHVLLGNHELMVMSGDLRYVAPQELRIAELHSTSYPRLFHPQRSVLGEWLASKPAMLRIDRVLFAHGGVTLPGSLGSLEAHRDSLASYLREELFVHWSDTTYVPAMDSTALARRLHLLWGDQSVFWHRGYVQSDTLEAELASVLKTFRSDLLVVGHTPVTDIGARYAGALIAAHPPTPATGLLLLTRTRTGGRAITRYALSGPPTPL